MVSRRDILSRSKADLNMESNAAGPGANPEDEEDVWYNKEKLFREHIDEVLSKWESIDDEIWAKIIVLERNRRVAKAYARAPVLTVNGTDDGFDGFRIGLAGFDNPMRDAKTEEIKKQIGQGCKIKMDDSGNILIKRIAKSGVFVRLSAPNEETAISNEVVKLAGGALEAEKPVKLFDMKKFQSNVSRELKRGYPDRRRLETQCICAVAFVRSEQDLLDSPCWIMLINVVAIDMLKSKMPPVKSPLNPALNIRNRPGIPVPDEDPYSIAGSGSSGSSGNGNGNPGGRDRSRDKPPKLPPRDNYGNVNGIYGTTGAPKPEYEHVDEQRYRHQYEERRKQKKEGKRSEDPYYFGLSARVPNFVKSKSQKEKEREKREGIYARLPVPGGPGPMPMAVMAGHPMGWHGPAQHHAVARAYLDNAPSQAMQSQQALLMATGLPFRGATAVRPFDRNPTTWLPQQNRNGSTEWESYWQKEN